MISDALSSIIWSRSQPRNATIENPTFSLNDPRAFDEMFSGSQSESGVRVTHASALSIGAVWQCVSTISGDVATATLNIFKVSEDDDREIDWDHDAQSLIAVQPNDEMSAFKFWRVAMAQACLWQNAYAFVLREGRSSKGRKLALLNLLPDRTQPMRMDDGTKYYVSEVDGQLEPFRADEIIHIEGLSIDGSKGRDLVEDAKNCFGLALAAEGFGSRFFKHGAQSGGVLEIPATFTEKAKQVLEEGFDKKYAGKENWFKTVILRDGAKFNATTIDAQKSQMHELREDQVRDVARFFNMPPSKVGLQDSVSYNSLEQSQIAYITGCLNHWFASIRGECNIKLLSLNERMSGDWYCEHNVSKLIETDAQTMNSVLEIQRRNEIINANEWRRKIGLNRRKDPGGDEYQNPNTKSSAPSEQQNGKQQPPKKGSPPSDPEQEDGVEEDAVDNRLPLKQLFRATIDRLSRRVCFDARNSAKKSAKFASWLDGKAHEHREVFNEQVLLVAKVIDSAGANALAISLDGQFFSQLINSLNPLLTEKMTESDFIKSVDLKCSEFEATIADKLTDLVFEKDSKCVQAA